MPIKVFIEDGHGWSYKTGGEFGILELEVHIDKDLTPEEQKERVIHSVVENYCRSWPHNKVEELTSEILEALSQWKQLYESSNKDKNL